MGLVSEFKEFALKGNMVDLAVGLIIGTAFGAVVNSLVLDVMSPPLGWVMGGVDFKDKAIILAHKGATHPITGKVMPADLIFGYGKFLNSLLTFVIQAIAVFILVKAITRARRKPPAPDAAPPAPPEDVRLLTEIRDLLSADRSARGTV